MKMKQIISTTSAPGAIGPYSQAVYAGNTLYVSGQLGADPVSGELSEGVTAQAEGSLRNMKAILAAAGMDTDCVVKTTVFLTDMNNFAAVNAVYSKAFDGAYPARSCVAVAALPKGALVEIECVAVRRD